MRCIRLMMMMKKKMMMKMEEEDDDEDDGVRQLPWNAADRIQLNRGGHLILIQPLGKG